MCTQSDGIFCESLDGIFMGFPLGFLVAAFLRENTEVDILVVSALLDGTRE